MGMGFKLSDMVVLKEYDGDRPEGYPEIDFKVDRICPMHPGQIRYDLIKSDRKCPGAILKLAVLDEHAKNHKLTRFEVFCRIIHRDLYPTCSWFDIFKPDTEFPYLDYVTRHLEPYREVVEDGLQRD